MRSPILIAIFFLSFFPKIHFGQELKLFYDKGKELPYSFETVQGVYCEFDGYDFFGKAMYLCTHSNLNSAKMIGTNQLWPGGALNLQLSGASLHKLAMWDGGGIRISHIELASRVQNMDSVSLSSHSTQVAGQLIASGINPAAKGMAYQTKLKAWNFTNDNNEIIANAPNLLVSNHAYGTTVAWQTIGSSIYWYGDSALNMFRDWKFGYYDNRSRIWDSVAYANPYFLMVKSAGNDRGAFVPPGTTHYYWNGTAWALSNTTRDTVGPYDCMATFGNAKNILTVGACVTDTAFLSGNSNATVYSYSSTGPSDDGRIKPDLVAASGLVYSSTSTGDSAYAFLGGTSMSAPNVSGSLILLQEYHQILTGTLMKSASLKGLVLHTARNCKVNVLGPSYDCGWGVPDMPKAASYIGARPMWGIDELKLLQNDTIKIKVRILSSADTLKASICWTDPKASTGLPAYNDTTLKLINDLDMRLKFQSQIQAYPYILNPSNPAQAATKGDNFRDNFEQIQQSGLSAGVYEMQISHKSNLQNNEQNFSWFCDGIYEPMKAASNPVFSNLSNQQVTFSFTKGSGIKRIVIVQLGAVNNITLIDGTSYLASSLYGNGSYLGNNAYVVYNDSGSTVSISGLSPNQSYTFKVIEYNGLATQSVYANQTALSISTTTLPVEWLSFEGKQMNEKEVLLNWKTASEVNNQFFEIQRASQVNEFSTIDTVMAGTHSGIIQQYAFVDSSIINLPSIVYYRLKQIDFDGQYSYSQIIPVEISHPWDLDLIYPNPFENQVTLKFRTTYQSPIQAQFINMLGEIKIDETIDISNKVLVDIATAKLSSGIYFLKLQSGEFVKMYKVVRL